MTEQQPPKIEFPCDYPIKVVGHATSDYRDFVVEVVRKHAPDLDDAKIAVIDSRNGKFQSIRLIIRATGADQLDAIFQELKASGRVQMVL